MTRVVRHVQLQQGEDGQITAETRQESPANASGQPLGKSWRRWFPFQK
ncbi:hypothetical protein [Acidithiobacillus marinus]|nr:hypothetical protein [Acidithiobacillus marinus]